MKLSLCISVVQTLTISCALYTAVYSTSHLMYHVLQMHAWGNDPVEILFIKCVHSGMGKLQGVDNWLFDAEGNRVKRTFFEMLSDNLTWLGK